MHYIDLAVLAVCGFYAWQGYRKGAVNALFGILGAILGIWAAMRLGGWFGTWYVEHTDIPDKVVPLFGYLTAFALAVALSVLLGRMLDKMVNTVGLELPNRLAGAGLSIAKVVFFLGMIMAILGSSGLISPQTQEASVTYRPVVATSRFVQHYTIGLIPQAGKVFGQLDSVFIKLDSTLKIRERLIIKT